MPASEDFYRDQKKLNVVFMVTSIAMLGGTIWMMAQDHQRPWKNYQREFSVVKQEKMANERAEALLRLDQAKKAELDAELQKAKDTTAKQQAVIAQKEKELEALRPVQVSENLDVAFKKADQAQMMSKYDATVAELAQYDHNEKIHKFLEDDKLYHDLRDEQKRQRAAGAAKSDAKPADAKGHDAKPGDPKGHGDEKKDAHAEDGHGDAQKSLQERIAELTREVSRQKRDPEVSRYLRLIEDKKKHRDGLAKLQAKIDEASAKLEITQKTIKEREQEIALMNQGIEDVMRQVRDYESDIQKVNKAIEANVYGVPQQIRAMPILDGFASPLKIKQVALDDLPVDYNFKKVTRYDRCQSCHLGIDQPGFTKEGGFTEPYLSHPDLSLYLTPDSPHPVDKFGCTICHQGQGTATSFDWASHTPVDQAQRESWTKEYGWFFNHFHELPMYPKRFVESTCLKCHHDPYSTPQAEKLLAGYETVRSYGCFGCHEINGFKDDGTSIGPTLRLATKSDSPELRKESLPKVGPNLQKVSEKLPADFIAKWIRNPLAYRPSTKMPAYYDQMDRGYFGDGADGEFAKMHDLSDLATTEIHAITHVLYQASEKLIKDHPTPKAGVKTLGDPAKGKQLFETKGCVACHNHKAVAKEFPKKAENFGPDLSESAAKFSKDDPKQVQWLISWIRNPAGYNPHTYMPSLQLADQDAADIAAWILSVPGTWAKDVKLAELDKDALADMVLALEHKSKTKADSEAAVKKMSTEQQLDYLGNKTISRLGCFGCHNITGYDDAKPIGVALADWGRKDPHKLAFENVMEFVEEDMALAKSKGETHYYEKNDYFIAQMHDHQREGFLMQKLREPRSYDYKKIRRWEDRARMPKFNFTDEQRDQVATFILGLVNEEIPRKYVYSPSPEKAAQIKGHNLLEKYNCVACHVIKPGEYKYTPTQEQIDELLAAADKEAKEDYSLAGYHSTWSVPKPNPGSTLTVHGLPNGGENPDESETPDDPKKFVTMWEAASLKGKTIPSGIMVAMPKSKFVAKENKAPYGGRYAMELVDFLTATSPAPFGLAERDKAWQKSPPPLIREGTKVQTPWLYRFLRDPEAIRPAVALRMPKFNFRDGDVEAIADYFAAADGAPYPYIDIPERESSYLAEENAKHPNYLKDAWGVITNKDMCIKCHAVGGIKPIGKPEEMGPDLVRAPDRLRPDWMLRWIANPKRFVPYTAMPVNFPKEKVQLQDVFKGTSLQQLTAVRDALVNYSRVMDQLLGEQQKPPAAAAAAAADNNQPKGSEE